MAQAVFRGPADHTPGPTLSSQLYSIIPGEDSLGVLVYLLLSTSNPKVSLPEVHRIDVSEMGFAEPFPSHISSLQGQTHWRRSSSRSRHPTPLVLLARTVHLLLGPYQKAVPLQTPRPTKQALPSTPPYSSVTTPLVAVLEGHLQKLLHSENNLFCRQLSVGNNQRKPNSVTGQRHPPQQ